MINRRPTVFTLTSVRTFIAGIVLCFAAIEPCLAQTAKAREWLAELTILENGAAESQQTRVLAIRRELTDWLALNPSFAIDLPRAAAQPWSAAQLREEVLALRQAVANLLQNDPNQPFYLGDTVVTVTAPGVVLSPISDRLDQTEIRARDAITVSQAIVYLPGVAVDHSRAPRNQVGILIGGFDSRQVPLYLDGIPAYFPLDGFVDLNRYQTSDVAEIQVAKGYTSPLLGPNLLGGVVNLVTRQPQRALESDLFVGTGAGALLNSGVHIGSHWSRAFFQASADRLQSDFYPLSGGLTPNVTQAGDHRVNSSQSDSRYKLRAGWTPRGQDVYAVSYANQTGTAGVPPYSGSAPVCPTGNASVTVPCVTPKYWQWPEWNTDTVYFNSRTLLGQRDSLELRAFYSRYDNRLSMFDDATYATMNLNASSGVLDNRDHSGGVSGQFETRRFTRQAIGASFFVNNNEHLEQTTTSSRTNVASQTPFQSNRDRQSSFGIQDVITISSRLLATVGISADHLNGLEAQDLSSDRTHVVPFQVAGICGANGSPAFTDCTDHVWSFNPVALVSYSTETAGSLFVTAAKKSRFPTLKDRYSYKAGRAIPNPLLEPEHATTITAGYSRVFPRRTVVQVDVFRSAMRDGIQNIFFLSPLCSGGGRGGAGTCQQAINVASETHSGINLTLRTTPVGPLTVDAHYSYLDRDIRDVSGVFPTGMPKHKSVATATIRLRHGAAALASAQYQTGAVGMSDNGLPLAIATFATADIGGTLPIRNRLSVQAGIKNLFDGNYYYWEGFPEAGRNGYVTLRYAF